MKTNQIMLRDNLVEQRTSDSYFNANITLKNWNLLNPEKHRTMPEFWQIKATKEFVEYLKEKENIENPYFSSNKGTWMHPLLYVDFCMWISVEFKTMALKMVLDGLIQFRHNAGDFYKEMTAMIMEKYIEYKGCKPSAMLYIKEANMIKNIAGVGNKDRNEMTEKELTLITNLQKVNTMLISNNVGKDSRLKQLILIGKALT